MTFIEYDLETKKHKAACAVLIGETQRRQYEVHNTL